MKRKIVWLSFFVGLIVLIFMVSKIGIGKIWGNIKKVTITNFIILIFIRILYWTLRTINWKVILNNFGSDISLRTLFWARMGGHAVSQLTPAAQVGSELTRIMLINKENNRKKVFASVILDKTIEFLSVIFLSFLGILGLIYKVALSLRLKIFLISSVFIATIFIIFFILKQNRGILGWFVSLVEKFNFGKKISEKYGENIAEIDSYLTDFYKYHKKSFFKVFLLYLLLVFFWIAEIYLTMRFIGMVKVTYVDAFFITILGNFALVFQITPGAIGIYEITYVGLFAIFGLSESLALSLVFMRRILSLILAGFGLFSMFIVQRGAK